MPTCLLLSWTLPYDICVLRKYTNKILLIFVHSTVYLRYMCQSFIKNTIVTESKILRATAVSMTSQLRCEGNIETGNVNNEERLKLLYETLCFL